MSRLHQNGLANPLSQRLYRWQGGYHERRGL